jgi:hypothetical protein
VSLVVFLIMGVDEDIVKIYHTDGVNESCKCLANIRLEGY